MKTVLIANRGEIAVRIIRTCKKIGLKTVAVYSENDEGCLHTRVADASVCIGPRQAEKSYLNIESILAAAHAYGVDMIHPGVGFLSESAAFAQACKEQGLIFVGPDETAMRLLGDKLEARRMMIENGFPVVSGSNGAVGSVREAIGVAGKIGYPVMLKASKGGGGKGIRVVRDEKELESQYPLVCREAAMAFGDPGVYIEAYLSETRHIEVQILADGFGNTLHLGTRECSLQRKNQKLLEEAPAANIQPDVLQGMQRMAVDIAKCVGYKNAGTVEFLLDKNNQYYFMEMNARLQVEHPVTESVYGLDLVKAQIQVAMSHRLGISQKQLVEQGHAIECRINAEDPMENFRPSPGVITGMVLPGGNGIRVDSGFAAGDEISPYYDSMVLKLICTGDDRSEAIRMCIGALDELRIEGIHTNADYARAMLQDSDFLSGKAHTKWIEQVFHERYLRRKR